jgi:hypothetical protein
MPTFNNLEGLDSVRIKINTAITQTEQNTLDIVGLGGTITSVVSAAQASADAAAISAANSANSALSSLTQSQAAATSANSAGVSSDEAIAAALSASSSRNSASASEVNALAYANIATTQAGIATDVVEAALQESIRNFPTRADALAWVALNPTPTVGTMLHWEGVSVWYDGVNTGLPAPSLAGYSPANDILNIKHTASASSLSSDFAGVMAQAIADASTKNWKLLVPKGNWTTQPILYDFPSAGTLDLEFAQGAKLIGPAQFQHFAGNGTQKVFTLTSWATASTDVLVAMKVSAADVETVLPLGNAVSGFTRAGNVVTVGSAVTIATGETVVFCSSNSILKITGENGDVSLRIRGGYFDNGAMGYVASQASGTCVNLQTIRGVDWSGAPSFINTSKKSWMDAPLLRRGDSGLVLANIEKANIWGAIFGYQPDLGNYTTGLARGTPPETYYDDDGRFINFFGCHAYGCDGGFRSARKGGGTGFYGCSVNEVSTGFLADDVSSGGLGSSRNIIIQGMTGRKIGRDFLDIRGVNSCVISGVTVEDWGRKPDGTVVNTRPLFNFGSVKHLHASGIVARYEEWTPPTTPQAVVSFANGRTIVDKFEARIERPYASLGDGSVGVTVSGGIGPLSHLPLDITTINVDTPLVLPGSSVDNAVVADIINISHDGASIFTVDKWRVAKARVIPTTTDVEGESFGLSVIPTLTIQTPNGAVVTPTGSSTGKYVRQGNIISAKLSLQANVAWGGSAPSGFIRMTWGAGQLPDVGEIFGTHVSFWNTTNPIPGNISDISVFRSAANQLTFRLLKEDGTNTILDAAAFYATGSTFFRIDLEFQYALDGLV